MRKRLTKFFEPLNDGWFIEWAVENKARESPKKAITVIMNGVSLCGFVPCDWDGSCLYFQVSDKVKKLEY